MVPERFHFAYIFLVLWSLSLSTLPLSESQRLWCPGRWCHWSLRLSRCFALRIPAAELLWGFEVPTSLLISSVRWLPRVWVPFLFHTSLSGVLVPSWFLSSLSLFFFPFCSTQLCGGFLALFGGVKTLLPVFSRCSVQIVLHEVLGFFLMCLW